VKKTACIVALTVLISAPTALADWDTDDMAKWVQMPDLDSTGIDVSATAEIVLADDYLCTEPDSITAIHIWGSWRYDYLPQNSPDAVDFTICIYADIPDSVSPTGYSTPGDVLWTKVFPSGEFSSRVWAGGIAEGFWNPLGEYKFPGDTICYQYNFPIPKEDYFYQSGTEADPVVYWLSVQAKPADQDAAFGWKTSLDHWNDDAVWGQGEPPIGGPWEELRYPANHEMAGQSIDLAFVIIGDTYGLDWGDAPDTLGAPYYPTLAAHNGASHVARGPWFGNRLDMPDTELDGQPQELAYGDDYNGRLDESGIHLGTLRPGQPSCMMYSVQSATPGDTASYVNIWIDWNGNGIWESPGEERVSYWVRPDTTPAGSPNAVIVVPPEDAVEGWTFLRARVNSDGPLPPDGPAENGEVEDRRVFIERDYGEFKWLQLPSAGENVDVMATQPYILADDFMCVEPGRIHEITIWGAWEEDELPFGNGPDSVKFILSIHANEPDSASPGYLDKPGNVLWTRTFVPGEFFSAIESVVYGDVWMVPPSTTTYADTVVWRYKFSVPTEEAFVQSGTLDEPEIYWLDLQAWPYDEDAHFGWKSSPCSWRADAQWGMGMEPYMGPWTRLLHRPIYPISGVPLDLAFMLNSDPASEIPSAHGRRGDFGLRQNIPNPFPVSTTIRYALAERGHVEVEIFDVRGELIATLVEGVKPAGEHSVTWNGQNAAGNRVPSGVYFYRMKFGGRQASRKMLLLR